MKIYGVLLIALATVIAVAIGAVVLYGLFLAALVWGGVALIAHPDPGCAREKRHRRRRR